MHHCLVCSETEYLFAAYPGNIDHHHNDKDHTYHIDHPEQYNENNDSGQHNCGIFAGENESCNTELQYLKNDFESLLTSASDKLVNLPASPPDNISLIDACCSECIAGKIMYDYIEPPPKLVAKSFLLYTSQLKYC